MSENQIVVHQPQSNVLSRIGAPGERQYLIQIMAEQLGIPASQATRTDVLALLGAAAQHTMQYGWIPGIHTHVQKFETEESKANREKNKNAPAVYTYTLVVGEKAWKDSGTRWRERGVQWRYQRKPMTIQEVAEEARLQGFSEKIAANSYGFWSRVLILGQDDPQDEHDPTWSAGIWFGKVKTGRYWREDSLPTGVSARDVAMRRADKRAMMQSQLTLLPVDDLPTGTRLSILTDNLRSEAEVRGRLEAPMQHRLNAEIEEDGDMIWAAEPAKVVARPGASTSENSGARPGVQTLVHGQEPENSGARPGVVDEDFYGDDILHSTAEDETPEVVARPVAPEKADARPDDRPEKCPVCHAPAGKPHTKKCTNQNAGARPVENPVAVSAPIAEQARPEPTPEKASARPRDQNERVYTRCTAIYGSRIPLANNTKEFIRLCRIQDGESAMMMSAKYYGAVSDMMMERLGASHDEADMIAATLVGYMPTFKHRPGLLVHAYLINALKDGDAKAFEAMAEIMELCQQIYMEEVEDGD